MSQTELILDVVTGATERASHADAVYSRRAVLKQSGAGMAALALAGVPLGLAMAAQTVQAQASGDPTAALVAVLKFKYLESAFYAKGLATAYDNPFLPDELEALNQIAKHEVAHIAALRSILGGSAPTQPATSSYDFTGGSGTGFGPFRGVFGSPAGTAPDESEIAEEPANKIEFFKLAMLFEDLSVRLCKGALPALLGNGNIATLLGIHSVEARHAAEIRLLRGSYNIYDPSGSSYTPPELAQSLTIMPWITSDYSGFVDYAYPTYPVYTGGLTQQDIANGRFSSTYNDDGTEVRTTIMVGVYGPPTVAPLIPVATAVEDNIVQSSSQVAFAIVGSQEIFDEPISMTAAATLAALFGVSA